MCLRLPYVPVRRSNRLFRNLCQKLSYEAEHTLKLCEQNVVSRTTGKEPLWAQKSNVTVGQGKSALNPPDHHGPVRIDSAE